MPAAIAQTLPTPWTATDVGSPTLRGSASFGSGMFTVNGGGTDIDGTTDQFYFVYRPLSGDGEIVARVESLTRTDAQAKAGVMIREALTADSRHAMMTVIAAKGYRFLHRPIAGESTISSSALSGGAPGWVKLARTGDTFVASWSTDGINWTIVGAETISMGETVYVGLAVTSRDRRRLAQGVFSNVAVSSSSSGNQSPAVTITQPANGTQYSLPLPSGLTIDATATDPEGRMASVGFYVNNTLIATDTTAPYSVPWSPSASGTYTIAAMAQDADGGSSWSTSVTVTVQGGNSPPTVTLTSPAANATFTAPASIWLSARASDAEGPIARVELYSGRTLLWTESRLPYEDWWRNVPEGTYTLTAVAYDGQGAKTTSAPVTVTVKPSNGAPTVTLTSPANGWTATAPATVNFAANASDPENQLARVEFYSGTTLRGTDTTAPYTFSWSNVAAGSYTLTAKVFDAAGNQATSAAVTIIVATTTTAPTAVVFNASADHATNVTSYRLSVYAATANPATATPIATSDLGKPTPAANNEITVDRASFFSALPIGSYLATVTAIGPGGQTQSSAVSFSR